MNYMLTVRVRFAGADDVAARGHAMRLIREGLNTFVLVQGGKDVEFGRLDQKLQRLDNGKPPTDIGAPKNPEPKKNRDSDETYSSGNIADGDCAE